MKNKRFAFFAALLAALLLCFPAPISVKGAEAFSESATVQAYDALVAYCRMNEGLSPFYVLDQGETAHTIISEKDKSVSRAQRLAADIVAYKQKQNGVSSPQAWLDSELVRQAGNTAEWYVLALRQSGKYDFSAYRNALLAFLQKGAPATVQTKQKFALALLAAGDRDSDYVAAVLEEPLDKQGIMAQIYGLHLLNNGLKSARYTAEDLVNKLLSLCLSDGGWAVMGKTADVDVTAMVLQALAPHKNDPAVKAAIDRALNLLSGRQQEAGDFASMGVRNAESTAQVMLALSALGVDCASDSRFIKNKNTVFDGLEQYRNADGSFSHTAAVPAKGNQNTAVGGQNASSAASSSKAESGKSSVSSSTKTDEKASVSPGYVTSAEESISPPVSSGTTDSKPVSSYAEKGLTTSEINQTEEQTEAPENHMKTAVKKTAGYKPFACAVVLILAVLSAVFLLVFKKWNRKNALALCGVTAFLLLFILLTNFQTAKQYRAVAEKQNVVGSVTLSIDCHTVADQAENVPADGLLLPETTFFIEEGETVCDILLEAAKTYDIQIEKKGANGMVYIAGIAYLYECQFGDLSGWVYHVNGESPFVGCDHYVLSDGDKIEWFYTLDLGVDVGNTFTEEE